MVTTVMILVVMAGTAYYVAGAWRSWLCEYPYDPRSYAQHPCLDAYHQGVTTLDGALNYYQVPLPPSAVAVRFYIEGGAFNGGGAFYLKFSAYPATIRAFIHQLGTVPADGGAEALWTQQEQSYEDDPVPWTFDSSYSAYSSKSHGDTVIVSRAMTTAYLFVNDG
jgi:hypothetical protein